MKKHLKKSLCLYIALVLTAPLDCLCIGEGYFYMKIITRQQAKREGLKHYFTGKNCINGHSCIRFVSNGGCSKCLNIQCKNYWIKYNDKEKLRAREYRKTHPEQNREQSRRWRKNNPEKIKEINRIYSKNNRQYRNFLQVQRIKRQRLVGKFTFNEWIKIKKTYNYTCLCCLKKEPEIKLTQDHVIPLIKKGLNIASNIQPLCRSCNSKKGTQIIDYRI
jgi:5-methylcytosine-specific restriction endonuclease McrA